jgi:hypothetical protein
VRSARSEWRRRITLRGAVVSIEIADFVSMPHAAKYAQRETSLEQND